MARLQDMRYSIPTIVFTILLLFSCGTDQQKKIDIDALKGTWTLFKEMKNGETKDYSGVPTASKIEFKENGYYVFFDQITDEKISKSGVGNIQDNLKGQFELNEHELILNHYIGDSLAVKKFTIESLSSDELVLVDKQVSKTSYFRH